MQDVVIIGAGGFAREVLDIFDAVNAQSPTYNVLGYIVDAQYQAVGTIINDKPILGDLTWFSHNKAVAICGIGDTAIRYKIIQRAAEFNVEFCSVIHPSAILTRWVSISEGTIITAGCIFTNQIRLGRHVHVNLDCTVGHDCVFEDFVTLAPGVHISGNVHLQEGCYIGTGANIIEKKTIGRWSIVGAGSAIVKDVEANTTVVGVPGQMIKKRDEGWYNS